MKSPKLFNLIKISLQDLIKHSYKLDTSTLNELKMKEIILSQQNNQLFRLLEKYYPENNANNFIKDVVFVDCSNNKNYQKELKHLLKYGFIINGIEYKFYGKSASHGRSGVIAALSKEVFDFIDTRAMMGVQINKTVLSKFEAYKHLLFSSCFCLECELPYMIVVKDYKNVIKNVDINYVDEIEKTYECKETGDAKIWKEKIIKEGIKDIDIIVNDGAGLISKEYSIYLQQLLDIKYTPSYYMLRMPFIKGISINFDFKSFYKEREIDTITDVWGKVHKVQDIDIILTESQYKGLKYFKNTGTYEDWEEYLRRVKEYDFCLGIAKWNYSHQEEPKMTRANYQILQSLNCTTKDLIDMSAYTREWIENILNGDLLYIYNYLGLNGYDVKPSNNYMRAILLNPGMLEDIKMKHYLNSLLQKTIDEIKVGKIYIKGAFKTIIPDLIYMAEYIGGLTPKGILKKGEMYAKEHEGEYVLNRNPHITASESRILSAINNDTTEKWLSHLENICMVNSYDVTAPALNGCDFDGDLVLVHKNEIFLNNIDRNLPITMDVNDKITAIEKEYNTKNLINYTTVSLDSRIGEISNCASAYHNKKAKTPEKQKLYRDYTCLLSVINGKEIDYSKTGVRWNVPLHISRGAKPLPYFLKYKYSHMKKTNNSKSPLNEHCWYIEKWEKGLKRKLRNKKHFINTSQYIINNDNPFDEELFNKVAKIYKEFKKEIRHIKEEESMLKDFELYKEFWDDVKYKDIIHTEVDYQAIYLKYKSKLEKIVENQSELANYVVELVYNKDHGKYYQFLWNTCENGILTNLRLNQQKPLWIPVEDKEGTEYLGRYYKLVEQDVKI